MTLDKTGVEKCLSLILDKHLYIRYMAGQHLDSGPSPMFLIGKSIHDVEWTSYFVSAPEKLEQTQLLMSKQGDMFVYIWSEISNATQEAEYILSFLHFSRHPLISLPEMKGFASEENHLIMESEPMQRIVKIIQAISNVDSTVLLLGESGVGKSAIAKLIHQLSKRADKPFVSVNCGALPENLIESELFGYEHGSFTGGKKGGSVGLFEVADEGTIFLDEIAELPFNLQAKLLNVLQENTIRKVGSTIQKKINVRIIAATNKELTKLVKQKSFREDLYYRLNVVPLIIPSLRERKKDIPYLINYFLAKYNQKYGLSKQVSTHVKNELTNYSWPGNIRELENTIERMVVTNSQEGFENLSDTLESPDHESHHAAPTFPPLKKAKKQLEKELILRAYEHYGSTYKAAEVLEVDQSTIVKKLKEYRKG